MCRNDCLTGSGKEGWEWCCVVVEEGEITSHGRNPGHLHGGGGFCLQVLRKRPDLDIQRCLFFQSVVHSAWCVGGFPHVVNLHKIQLVHCLSLVHTVPMQKSWSAGDRRGRHSGLGSTRNFPGTGPGDRSDAVGQLRTGFYYRFIAAFLPPSLPRVLSACSLPRAGLSASEGEVGAPSDTVCAPWESQCLMMGGIMLQGPRVPMFA